jgi:hypothetical protein
MKGEDDLKTELLSNKEPELGDFENSQPIYITKYEKACFEDNTKGIAT